MRYLLVILFLFLFNVNSYAQEIIIKQLIPKTKSMINEEGEKINTPYFDVFFDVETDTEQYVDKNGKGYFPIEIKDKGQTEEEIKQECLSWLNEHNILSIYEPTYKSKREMNIKRKGKEILERQAIKELDER